MCDRSFSRRSGENGKSSVLIADASEQSLNLTPDRASGRLGCNPVDIVIKSKMMIKKGGRDRVRA
ncbi:hypothetical protein GCM10023156_44660 [Novipirellula rosea]|uniref:Uncharacterized protein n=1 Tax=Novipirellula rosea TaxID=1031540 RepID=A0ABP8N8E4_9BACT